MAHSNKNKLGYTDNYKVPNRANSTQEKLNVTKRLFALWLAHPELRLGQLIVNHIPEPYHVEDFDLINRLEQGYK